MNFLFYKNEIERQDKTEILLKIEKKKQYSINENNYMQKWSS